MQAAIAQVPLDGNIDGEDCFMVDAVSSLDKPRALKGRRVSFNKEQPVVHFVDPIDEQMKSELFYDSEDFRRFQVDDEARWQRALQRRLRRLQQREADERVHHSDEYMPQRLTEVLQRECLQHMQMEAKEMEEDTVIKKRHARGKRKPSRSAPAA